MKLIDMKVLDFTNLVDSKSPAPGGGSVSALCGSLGTSLARMVGHLTIGKKKFLALDVNIQKQFIEVIHSLEGLKNELLMLVDKDTEAFNQIMAAYQLKKETEEEIKLRNEAILEATLIAIDVPFQVANIAYQSLELMETVIKYGNRQAISDLGVAVLNLSSSIEGALMNVLINLPGVKDINMKNQMKAQAQILIKKVEQLKNEYLKIIYQELNSNL